MKKKLVRITTVSGSLRGLLKGQLRFMGNAYHVIGISSEDYDGELEEIMQREKAESRMVPMTRKITPFKDLAALYRLYQILRDEKPLFVHTHTPKAGLIGMMAAYLARVPHRMHDIAGLPLVEATGFKLFVLKMVERLTYACATIVYPNSRGLHQIVLDAKFAKPTKFKVLERISSNGVDTEWFDKTKVDQSKLTALKLKYGIEDNDFVYLFIGRLVTDKGINELVAAFKQVQQKNPNSKLILVGGEERDLDPLHKNTLEQIDNNNGIIATGPMADVRPFYALANALVFPSYREGFPNVPMEAGSMQLASIVSDINGCNEIIIEGENGLIITTKNVEALVESMTKLATDRELLNKLSSNARPMIKNRFEQKKVWEVIFKEYQRLEEIRDR